MKKVAVFFKQPGAKDYPFTKNEYWNSYQELDTYIREQGGSFYITRNQSTYTGSGHFSQSWQFEEGVLKETGPITVDVVYDKGEFASDDTVPVLNSPMINDICTDKHKTYELFSDLCPQTIQVETEDAFLEALKTIPGERKVIKPVDDEEGNGVFIGDDEYLKKCPYGFPLLVQEFLDTSCGIPGIIEGIHDFRAVLLNGEIIHAFVRTPPPGELLANVSQGGSLKIVDKKDIPESAKIVTDFVDAHMSQYGMRYYGIDIAFTDRGPKIIELNSRVGLFENARHAAFVDAKKKLSDVLVNLSS